jgi:glycosyltransferase involved in cell wall biosynthesis
MKVLFLPRWYPNPSHPYEGVFVREHARAAQAAGVQVAVLHMPDVAAPVRGLWRMDEETDPGLSAGIPTYHVLTRPIRIPGLRALGFRISSWLQLWAAWRAFRRLRSEGFEPDLIHGHVHTAGSIAVFLGRRFGLPVVLTEHSSAFPRRTIPDGALRRAKAAFETADRVLPVSASLQRAIESYGIRASFTVVPNTVDTALFHPAPRPSGRGRGEPRRLIFVGNLEPTGVKGFPTLVEALKLLGGRRADWVLDVVGDGPSRPEYEGLVETAGLNGRVVFHGRLPKTRIAEMMRASDLLVLPSRFENLPCVIIEAMSSGLPVVSTSVGGIPELVGALDGILVPPEQPAALAGALADVLGNPGRFDSSAVASRAAARYGLEAVGSQLASIYADVAAAHSPEGEPGGREGPGARPRPLP